jgi:hypothetical protein
VPCAVLCEVTAERLLLRRRHWRTNRPQTAAVTAEPQLQVESPDSSGGKACETRKTCQAALVEVLAEKKARSTNWNGPHHDKPLSAIEQGLPITESGSSLLTR